MNPKYPDETARTFAFGRFVIDIDQRILNFDGKLVHLAPRSFELLTYFLQRKNQVIDKEELMSQVWSGLIVEDANLSVHVSSLRKILAADDSGSVSIQTFPKKGYRFVVEEDPRELDPGVDIPSGDVILEPASEERLPATEVRPAEIVPADRRLRLLSVVAVFLCAATFAGSYVYRRSVTQAVPAPDVTSLAVLPFRNERGEPELEYLADGMTESVLRRLSSLPGLLVKARATVFAYKGRDVEPQTVGREISAQAILIGRISKQGDALAVNYELVEVDSSSVIVSGAFRSDSGDFIQAENEIVQNVSAALRPELAVTKGGDAASTTQNRDALALYLKGRDYWNRRTVDDLRAAIGFFQRAIETDPDFALAYSGLADAYSQLASYGGISPADARPQAKSAALKAISLNSRLAEAHASLGQCLLDSGTEFAAAEREIKQAIELNPSYASAHQWYAELLTSQGRFDEARIAIRRAIVLDPLSRIMRNIDGRISLFAGRYDEAILIFKKNIDLDPSWGGDHDLLFHAYEGKGMYKESVAAYLAAHELDHRDSESELAELRTGFNKGGWQEFVRVRIRQLKERSSTKFVRPSEFAEFHARRHDNAEAIARLKQMVERSPSAAAWIEYLPVFKEIRSEPRYRELSSRFVH